MTPWQSTRALVLASQDGQCASLGCPVPALDVVTVNGEHVAYCRSHRLKLDASIRIPKARHTKIVKREQVSGQVLIEDLLTPG